VQPASAAASACESVLSVFAQQYERLEKAYEKGK
jgi:hypothetical protein